MRFLPDMWFEQNHKSHYVHDVDQKNLHINEQIFMQNPKNPIFCGSFGDSPQTDILPPKKSGSISFYPQGPLTS